MFAQGIISQETVNIVTNQVWEVIGEMWMLVSFLGHISTAKPSEENEYDLEIKYFWDQSYILSQVRQSHNIMNFSKTQ